MLREICLALFDIFEDSERVDDGILQHNINVMDDAPELTEEEAAR